MKDKDNSRRVHWREAEGSPVHPLARGRLGLADTVELRIDGSYNRKRERGLLTIVARNVGIRRKAA